MKKAMVLLAVGTFSLFFCCSPGLGRGLQFGFKFTGGMNYMLLGDADAPLRAMKTRTDDYLAAWGSGDALERTSIPFLAHFGYEFDADAIVYLSPQFGVSLGTGYVRGGTMFGSGHQILATPAGKETDFIDMTASAIPIKAGIYYAFSTGFAAQGKSTSYLFAGIGIYSAKYTVSEEWAYLSSWENYSFQAKASQIGFHGGLGGENWINPGFAFVYELFLRYAKIGGFTGDWQADDNGWTSSGSGKLYSYEWLDSSIGNWYPGTWVFANAPSGSSTRNVREAKIDFSAIGFKFGIKFNI